MWSASSSSSNARNVFLFASVAASVVDGKLIATAPPPRIDSHSAGWITIKPLRDDGKEIARHQFDLVDKGMDWYIHLSENKPNRDTPEQRELVRGDHAASSHENSHKSDSRKSKAGESADERSARRTWEYGSDYDSSESSHQKQNTKIYAKWKPNGVLAGHIPVAYGTYFDDIKTTGNSRLNLDTVDTRAKWNTDENGGGGQKTAVSSTGHDSEFYESDGSDWENQNGIELQMDARPTELLPITPLVGGIRDADYMYALGLLEGYLTAYRISQNVHNLVRAQPNMQPNVFEYLRKQDKWMRHEIKYQKFSDPYWHSVALFVARLDGILAGYKSAVIAERADVGAKNAILDDDVDLLTLYQINVIDDLDDVNRVLAQEPRRWGRGHCSALIKLNREHTDLSVGHTTWTAYRNMLRVYKTLRYPQVEHQAVANTELSFSSYPGYIGSMDDWFTANPSQLFITETSDECLDDKRMKVFIHHETILTPFRAVIASMMAQSGRGWYNVFSRYNSGTQNDQWMIVDFKRFAPFNASSYYDSDLLWVVEQMPGEITARDRTDTLYKQGYWASFNLPRFETTKYAASNNLKMLVSNGTLDQPFIEVCENQREVLFDNFNDEVHALGDMGKLLRDPTYVWGCPECAIGARFDLKPMNVSVCGEPMPFGAIDCKLTNHHMVKRGETWMQSGPTTTKSFAPPFDWSSFPDTERAGLPDKWDFGWKLYSPGMTAGDDGKPPESPESFSLARVHQKALEQLQQQG